MKLVVTRSSTLQVVPQSSSIDRSTNFFQNLHGSYSDSEVFCKKELAGRTMEFSFDVSQTPLIGRRLLLKPDLETNVSTQAKIVFPSNATITGTPNSPRRSTSLSPADTAPLSGWKRPWMSQSRVRECLVNLLTTCGQRVGLPKSPSVSINETRLRQLIYFWFRLNAAFGLFSLEFMLTLVNSIINLITKNICATIFFSLNSMSNIFAALGIKG